jgi:hypothetical protein
LRPDTLARHILKLDAFMVLRMSRMTALSFKPN